VIRRAACALLALVFSSTSEGASDMHAIRCHQAGYASYEDGWCAREDHGVLIHVRYDRALRGPLRHYAGPMQATEGGKVWHTSKGTPTTGSHHVRPLPHIPAD
jgi:hypothetical protein